MYLVSLYGRPAMEVMDPSLEYIALDLETTGLDARSDRVVEIGAIRVTASGLGAHHASFDAGFLGAELRRAGYEMPEHRVFDTLALARRRHPTLSSHRLASLAALWGLEEGRLHRAMADATCVMKLWLALE